MGYLHYVLFDGTSAFVGDYNDIDNDTEIVFKSNNFWECSCFCDNYNDNITCWD